MIKSSLFTLTLFLCLVTHAQNNEPGVLSGNVMDSLKKAVVGANVELISFKDSTLKKNTLTDKTGDFILANVAFGFYKLRVSYVGMQTLTIDSIDFRTERFDFNLSDIVIKNNQSSSLGEIIVYAEKPLIQSADGNITFNAGESALAAGSNVSELLTNVPLVTKDPTGKILVRGKEPKILIDDKPVELNLQQLQDLLESLPGSSIEKIEVMTNPPPQYATEQGGVINIVTKKGKVGRSGRINVSSGTRGEAGISGNFNYRRQGFALNLIGGYGYNRFQGNSNSSRTNIYTDSSNYFNTTSNYVNNSKRPNFRLNMDYDLTKNQSFNFVLQYNQNDFHNNSNTEYTNINRLEEVYKISDRAIRSTGSSYNPSMNLSYLLKAKRPGETLKIITGINISHSTNDRNFYQQYFNADHSFNGQDSTQKQFTNNKGDGYSARVNYDLPLTNNKTFVSLGTYYTRNDSHIVTDASYLKKPDMIFAPSAPLSNNFKFHQSVRNIRGSFRQILGKKFTATAGLSAEMTTVSFDLLKDGNKVRNNYWSYLPFGNINKTWNNDISFTFSYRRTIRRPGINEQNPSIDFSDPYNIRFGNPGLHASTAHNFDLIVGKTKPLYFSNIAVGYNIVQDIFSQVRTLLPDSKTQITWENISGRKEYEISTWNGYTLTRKLKLNFSASYTYNEYSSFDRIVNAYRNGGSFTSNANLNYIPKDVMNMTGSFTFNRFATPQGYGKWSWSMNVGVQRKFFAKRFIVTANVIDPIVQQQTRNFTYGTNFILQSAGTTQTRNYRLTFAYVFSKPPAKKPFVKAVK